MLGVVPFAIKNSHKLQQRRVSVQFFFSSRVLLTSTYNLPPIPLDSPSAPFCRCLYSGLTPEVPAEIGSQCHQHHDTLQGETQDLPIASWVIHLGSHRIDRMACKSLANWWCAHDHCLELQGESIKHPVKWGKRSEASALKSTILINFAIGMSCIVMYMFDDVRSYPICNQELPQTPIKNGVCSILFQLKSIADKHVQTAPNSTQQPQCTFLPLLVQPVDPGSSFRDRITSNSLRTPWIA